MRSALIVVDMQYDFIYGSLSVPRAKEIIYPIVDKMRDFDSKGHPIFMTYDWHPINHMSFVTNGGHWPVHCVAKTQGAAFEKSVAAQGQFCGAHLVSKGQDPRKEEYSGFDNPSLNEMLVRLGVTDVFVCGLAREYCVHETAKASRKLGFNTTVLEDLCKCVNQEDL